MKTYLTKKYIGVKIITILSICAIALAITTYNKNQAKDCEATSIAQDDTKDVRNSGIDSD